MIVTEYLETVFVPRFNDNRTQPATDQVEAVLTLPTAEQLAAWNRPRHVVAGGELQQVTSVSNREVLTSCLKELRRYSATQKNGTLVPIRTAEELLESRARESSVLVAELVNAVLYGHRLDTHDEATEEPSRDEESTPKSEADIEKNS